MLLDRIAKLFIHFLLQEKRLSGCPEVCFEEINYRITDKLQNTKSWQYSGFILFYSGVLRYIIIAALGQSKSFNSARFI